MWTRTTAPMMIPTGFRAPVAVTLPQASQHIIEMAQPERIILFGSYADGVPTPDSNVDLLW